MRSLKPLITEFLKLQKGSFNKDRLELLVDSHPDYLSLNNITDTFDSLNIPNAAVEIKPDQLLDIQLPVITSIYFDGQQQFAIVSRVKNQDIFLILESLQELKIPRDTFFQLNYLVIVIVEIQKKVTFFKKYNLDRSWPYYFLISAILYLISFHQYELNNVAYNLLSLIGVIITFLIFFKENNINSFADKFCSDIGNTSCDDVLSSKGSKILGKLKLSDLSMLYFGTLFIASNILIKSNTEIKIIFSTSSLLIVPFSIFYQWHIIKKWCPLCLLIVSILITQFVVILFTFKYFNFDNLQLQILPIAFGFIITVSLWYVIKTNILAQQKWKNNELVALKFNRNHELFLDHYKEQKLISLAEFSSPVTLGSNNAKVKIIVVSNPLCKPCAETHQILDTLLDKFPNDIHIEYCFFCNPNNSADQKTLISEYLIRSCLTANEVERKQLLNNWYKKRAIAEFDISDSVSNDMLESYIRPFYQFLLDNEIKVAPSIIINARLIPMVYESNSLLWLMPYIIDYFTKNE
jgi:uncharacterized membrane protein